MQDKKKQDAPQNTPNRKKDDALPENSKKHLDKQLDEGVEETFPASDPVSVKITK